MRSAAITPVCCLLVSIAIPQVNRAPSLPPTPLEQIATRATAQVTWSKVIGSLESVESRATITALIVEDKTSEPSGMRGIRVDLAHLTATPRCDWKYTAWRILCERANAAIYIEEKRLEPVRNGISRGAAELRPMEFISRFSASGAGVESTGLIVCGYQFSNRQPDELANLITRAIDELKAAPR